MQDITVGIRQQTMRYLSAPSLVEGNSQGRRRQLIAYIFNTTGFNRAAQQGFNNRDGLQHFVGPHLGASIYVPGGFSILRDIQAVIMFCGITAPHIVGNSTGTTGGAHQTQFFSVRRADYPAAFEP